MKQLTDKNKKIFAIAIIALIIFAGIIVIATVGFNKEQKYLETQSIDIYIEQKVEYSKIKNIANDILGKNNTVQIIEIYEDMVTIKAKQISEEQKNNIVNKIKENYEFEQTAEETTINVLPETRIRDMYKQYVIPFIISGILVLVYMLIRYYKKGILKVMAKTVITPIIAELFLISVVAILRIPVGRIIPVLAILVYVFAILSVVKEIEK